MREKGQQSAKILTHLVTYRGEKKEKCLFLLYVGRCKGKTDICLFFFFFFYGPFPKTMTSNFSPPHQTLIIKTLRISGNQTVACGGVSIDQD